jgi:hypothetical protein
VERKLWAHLRNRQLKGAKSRRQYPIAPYVVDFFCLEAKLIVEVDGGGHATEAQGRASKICKAQELRTVMLPLPLVPDAPAFKVAVPVFRLTGPSVNPPKRCVSIRLTRGARSNRAKTAVLPQAP